MKITIEWEEGDFDSLHDTVFDLTDVSLNHEQLLKVFEMLPQHIKDDAIRWGVDDSVVRDNIYEQLEKELKEFLG
jgi:hypothetical protein